MKKTFLAIFLTALSATSVQATTQTPDTLAKILETKEIKVCSPGDYKPFSFDNNGQFEGLDNDLVNKLAASLDAKVTIVKTTWKTLLTDFEQKCDLAVGGISITLARQQKGLFSEPYFINGKTPIVRCENVKKYQTVEDINRPM